MGKPSRLSKQGKTLTLAAVGRNHLVITSALGCLQFSEENFSSWRKRTKQESDFTPVTQNISTRRGSDVLHHTLRRVVGKRTLVAHCLMKASEHVSPHWALIWRPDISRRSLVMATLGKVHNTSAGTAHLPLEITRLRLLLLQNAFLLCFGSSLVFVHVE